jgi:acetyl-CoA/propionyl-CoA carboxylase, biotin carboxylase, biotin carboxyl carrier protein
MVAGIARLLIANRGEIAVRVIRACREQGVEVHAVYEADDAAALHVELADAATLISSYLSIPDVVSAATAAGADAVHPGYGYLAENPDLAEAVERAGMRWVGPPAAAMRALGDKVAARRLAEAAGVVVAPGYAGDDLSDAALEREARRLGPPLLVKAAAGGGGRGMRAVDDLADLGPALASARREAAAAFGDDRLYLERRLTGARHVEVQVLADAGGACIHLGERDCSLQRRHQKIVEESPSPVVGDDLRAALGDAAVAIATAAGYRGAGTVEFLVTGDGEWCFLELNARLQVEHPVTEAVAGFDLVRAQLEIAAGEPLELEQPDVELRGHAIECRLYAEDPAAGFVPATGRLLRWRLPAWPGVRIDAGVREGDEVGVRYDPLLGKLIAHAQDRDACIERMAAALADTVVLGVTTNLGFLRWLLDQPGFRAGEAGIDFVEREWRAELAPELPDGVRRAAQAVGHSDIWHAFGPPGPHVETAGGYVLHEGWQYRVGADDAAAAVAVAPGGSLQAPMPGTVLRVDVREGQEVAAGEPLMVLEAMKMELAVSAPAAGTVTAVMVRPGDMVARGQVLAEVDPG